MSHKLTLITGDGTGPELSEAMKRCVEATGVDTEWDIQEAGIDVMDKYGTPLPDALIESIRKNKLALKAPITTPVGKGFRSVNVALRKIFDLYACLRPCKSYEGVRSKYKNINLVIVRENTEDLYAGIEFQKGTPEAKKVIDLCSELSKQKIRPDSGVSIKPISVTGSERIVKFAFEYARKYKRKKVTAVHKANIIK